jgi:succinate dehydrogenase hydrophobic anchor subunit
MVTTSRVVYGRAALVTPVWVWLLQRISALLLGPLVLIHVSLPGATHNPWVGSLLLLTVLSHGYVGLWRLIGRRLGLASSVLQAVMALLILCMGGLGVLILKTFL